jgi:hypothetical protein
LPRAIDLLLGYEFAMCLPFKMFMVYAEVSAVLTWGPCMIQQGHAWMTCRVSRGKDCLTALPVHDICLTVGLALSLPENFSETSSKSHQDSMNPVSRLPFTDPVTTEKRGCNCLMPQGVAGEGRTPSWPNRPKVSMMMRVSLIRPSSRRSMTIPQTRTVRSVAGIPRNSPL